MKFQYQMSPVVMRQTYQENFRRHRKQLTDDCRALHAELTTFRNDLSIIDAVTALVRRRRIGVS